MLDYRVVVHVIIQGIAKSIAKWLTIYKLYSRQVPIFIDVCRVSINNPVPPISSSIFHRQPEASTIYVARIKSRE